MDLPDPQVVAAGIGWLFAVGVWLVERFRRPKIDLPAIQVMMRAELEPIMEVVDKTDHDMASLRKEIGYAVAHTENTADRLVEVKSELERRIADQGQAASARVDRLEETVRGIIVEKDPN